MSGRAGNRSRVSGGLPRNLTKQFPPEGKGPRRRSGLERTDGAGRTLPPKHRRSALNRLCACLGHSLFQTYDLMRAEPVLQLTRVEHLRPLQATRVEIRSAVRHIGRRERMSKRTYSNLQNCHQWAAALGGPCPFPVGVGPLANPLVRNFDVCYNPRSMISISAAKGLGRPQAESLAIPF